MGHKVTLPIPKSSLLNHRELGTVGPDARVPFVELLPHFERVGFAWKAHPCGEIEVLVPSRDRRHVVGLHDGDVVATFRQSFDMLLDARTQNRLEVKTSWPS